MKAHTPPFTPVRALLLILWSILFTSIQSSATEARAPRILIDSAHYNFHTIERRYAPLARLLNDTGFRVQSTTSPFTPELLATTDALVIANALHISNVDRWALPVESALSEQETASLVTWVENGGALLLIADHFPFPGAVADLASRFGFRFLNGFAIRSDAPTEDIFDLETGSLKNHSGITGAELNPPVQTIATFTGSAFEAPTEAQPLMVLGSDYELWLTSRAWEFQPDTPRRPASGLMQGATRSFGKGRVAVFAEAAMFTSQIAPDGQTSIGFDAPAARDNRAFIVNIFRWLTEPLNLR